MINIFFLLKISFSLITNTKYQKFERDWRSLFKGQRITLFIFNITVKYLGRSTHKY